MSYSHTKRYLVKVESQIEKSDDEDGDSDRHGDQAGDLDINDMEVDEPIYMVDVNSEARTKREMEVTHAMQLDDVDLFANEDNVSQVVKDSAQYKERKSVFTGKVY